MASDLPEKRQPGALLSLWLVVCRFAVAGLLGFAAYHKLQDPQEFAFAIKAYKILPDHLIHVSAFAIPWLEALVALTLVMGLWARAAAFLSAGLLVSFIFAIASVMIRADVEVSECSCFGEAVIICDKEPGWCHIIQNTVLLAFSLMVAYWGPGRLSMDHMVASAPSPDDAPQA